jgi:hypothetical protein
MKRKIVLIAIICVITFFSTWLIMAIRAADIMNRADTIQSGIKSLSMDIETYRDNFGVYPPSIEDVKASESDPKMKAYVDQILHDSFNDKYEYQPLTNGFIIIVSSPSSWLIPTGRIEKRYSLGEALK